MFNSFKNFFRKRCLRKFSSNATTGIIPLSNIKSMAVFLDVEDQTYDECKNEILAFARDHNIHCEIFYFDFRRIEGGERLITSITNTVLKKDLNWYGRPCREKVDLMLSYESDLFISLIEGAPFPIRYMASCSNAKFKVGRKQIPGNVFDLVIKDPNGQEVSQADIFLEIRKIIEKIG